jgi:hypothetical protein
VTSPGRVADPYWRFRVVVIGLGVAGAGGTAVELAMSRHWNGMAQKTPWLALALVAVAFTLIVVRPNRERLWLARGLAVVVAVAALFGVWQHVRENRNAGPLDFRYAATWDSLSSADQWWKAFSKTVGPAPTLAPGVLAEAALCALAATAWHPAERRGGGVGSEE